MWFPDEQSVREAVAEGRREEMGLVDVDDADGDTVVAIAVARTTGEQTPGQPERFEVRVTPSVDASERVVVVGGQPIQ